MRLYSNLQVKTAFWVIFHIYLFQMKIILSIRHVHLSDPSSIRPFIRVIVPFSHQMDSKETRKDGSSRPGAVHFKFLSENAFSSPDCKHQWYYCSNTCDPYSCLRSAVFCLSSLFLWVHLQKSMLYTSFLMRACHLLYFYKCSATRKKKELLTDRITDTELFTSRQPNDYIFKSSALIAKKWLNDEVLMKPCEA